MILKQPGLHLHKQQRYYPLLQYLLRTIMHCVKIIYPREKNSYFNFDHYFEVHLPLALDAIKPYAEVIKIEVDRGEQGLEGTGDLPFHCICSVYFSGPDGPEGFRARALRLPSACSNRAWSLPGWKPPL